MYVTVSSFPSSHSLISHLIPAMSPLLTHFLSPSSFLLYISPLLTLTLSPSLSPYYHKLYINSASLFIKCPPTLTHGPCVPCPALPCATGSQGRGWVVGRAWWVRLVWRGVRGSGAWVQVVVVGGSMDAL